MRTKFAIASAMAAAVALAMFSIDVSAQEKKATTPSAKTEAKKPEPKPKSACNALKDEAACKANAECQWIAASVDSKTGKEKRKAYCRTKPKSAKKAKETKK